MEVHIEEERKSFEERLGLEVREVGSRAGSGKCEMEWHGMAIF